MPETIVEHEKLTGKFLYGIEFTSISREKLAAHILHALFVYIG